VNVTGAFKLPYDVDVSPLFTAASARPYAQYRGFNPSGDGQLMTLCPSGNAADVGFGAGQVPCGINNARGEALINLNARVTKNIRLSQNHTIALFAEFYNILNRANFWDQYSNFQGVADYGKPTGYIGGLGATSTIPISFQCSSGRVSRSEALALTEKALADERRWTLAATVLGLSLTFIDGGS
jgi:hypothetical protein